MTVFRLVFTGAVCPAAVSLLFLLLLPANADAQQMKMLARDHRGGRPRAAITFTRPAMTVGPGPISLLA
jgi:hypothetical protein